MHHVSTIKCGSCALLLSLLAFGAGSAARAAELPPYFKVLANTPTTSPADIATKNVLQLNTSMFALYDNSLQIFQKNILAQHPLILGLFTGAGGRFILYRPGQPPL